MRKAALVCFLVGLASLREARGSQTIVDLLPETSLTILDQQARDDLRESLDTAVDASIARLELRRNKFVVDHWVKDGMVLVEFADGTQGVIYKSLPQEADSPYSPSHRLGDFYDRLRRADPRLDAPEGTQSFAVTHDADVDQSNPAMNYGSNAYAFVGSIGGFSQLAFFRAAAVSVIGQVTYGDFAVYWETCAGYNGGLGQFNARPVASTWSESTINYSNQPGYRATAPSSVQFTQCSPSSTVNHFDWLYFEMTDWITNWHLGSWPHYGVRIDLGNSGLPGFPNFKFSTSESVAAQRPEFYVEYDTCWYTVSPTSCTLPANASTCSFGVTTLSQCDWSTNESLSWLTVTSGSTGRGSGTVTYSVAANSGAQRSGNVSVQGQVHTVTQEGAAATLTSVTVSGSATVPESSGAQYTATANWSDGTTTNVTNSSSWSETCAAATISSTGFLTTSAVTSNQPCQVSASYTSGTTQTGSLSITITETGGNCTLQVLSPNGGETWIIGSTVSASWTTSGTGCPAQVRIEIYKGGVMHAYFPSAFPPTQSVNFLVDSSWATPGNDYRLRMSDWNNSQFYDESNANFSIQNNCSYSISPTTGGFGPGGGTGSFAVTAPAGCPWSASSNQTWASITSGGSGSGSGTVSYSVAAYGGTGTRAAAITAGGLTHSITQTGSTQSCTLHVLSPNGGEVWIAGATATRAYTSSGTGCPTELRLELYRSGVMAEAWPNPQPPSSSVTFVVGPGHADGNDYRLRISDWNNSQFYDESDADFSIFNSPCTYSINPTGASVGAGGGSGSVAVTTSSGCGWTASSNSNWLSVTSGTSGNGSGNVQYSVASNAGGARTGTITIAGRVFTITQSPGTSTGCAPGWDTLCLMGNRFEVRATYTDYANNTGSGQAVALTADSGYFWFFDPSNVEAVGKIVSFCGTNGSFGYYAGGLTDVGVTMTVRDTVANQTQTFTNARGHRFDMISSAFNTCQGSDGPEETSISQPGSSEYSQPSPSEDLALPFEAAESSDLGAEIESLLRTAVAAAAPSRAVSTDSASEEWGEDNDAADGVVWSESQDVGRTPCFASSTTLCLYNNRFEVRATYTDYSNNSGPGQAVALTSDSGYFWFFDSSNVEAVGKMVSFCGTNGSFGFYAGGLTDVGVVMTVRDTVANQTQTFTNARGHRFNMISSAFNTCP